MLAWPFGLFLPKPSFEPGLPHFTQHYIQVDMYRCIRRSICVTMLSFLPPYPKSPFARRLCFSHPFTDGQTNPLGSVLPASGMHSSEGSLYYTFGAFWGKQEWNPGGDLLPCLGNGFPTCIKPAVSPEICAGYLSFKNSCLLKGYIWYATIQGNVMQCSQFNSLQDKNHKNNNNKSFQDGDQATGKRTG